MFLIIYLILLFIILKNNRGHSPALLLIAIYLFSLLSGLLIEKIYAVESFFQALNLLYLAIILTIFILPWHFFRYASFINEPKPSTVRNYTILLFIINSIAFIVFITIFYSVHPEVSDYEAFKNDGLALDSIRESKINHQLILFSTYFHSTAYFLIPLHFFYFKNKKYILSLISFILSLNIAFFGLTVFSRSSIVEYAMLYIFYLSFFYKDLKERIKFVKGDKVILFFSFGAATGFIFFVLKLLYQITENRFKDSIVGANTIIENPVLYFLFDYASQWLENSNRVMSNYSFETLNGELSFPLIYVIANKLEIIHYPVGTIENRLHEIWGIHFNTFNGLISNLLYDFGYLGTLGAGIIYFIIVLLLRPVKGRISFNSFLSIGIFFIIPAMGIFNYHMRSLNYNGLLFLFTIVWLWNLFYKHIICSIKKPNKQKF